MSTKPNYNRIINRAFQPYGLPLHGDAAKLLKQKFDDEGLSREQCDEILKRIVAMIKESGLRKRFIDANMMSGVLGKLENQHAQTKKDMILVFNAFDTPRFRYETVRKTWEKIPHRLPLHADADAKAGIHLDRYQLLHQRMLRSKDFCPPPISAVVSSKKHDYVEITQIESLICDPGRKLIFGMLTQLVEGKWFIEDMATSVQLDISSEVKLVSGLFTEGCMVLADGVLTDGIFKVESLGFPPPEKRKVTLKAFPQLDCFGYDFQGRDKEKEKQQMLTTLFEERTADMMVILSDVHLDKPAVLAKLRRLFDGMKSAKPPLFVFMGNFSSKNQSSSDAKKITGYFDALADLILEFPSIYKQTKFVFVPGPQDPGLGNVLPRPPIPHFFTKKLREKLPNVEFTSNPCRILYYGKEYVFFREDLLHKMRRNCVLKPNDKETPEISEHLVKTVMEQAHLCPLPITNRPIYWNYDHSLRLYPLPHVLVLADTVDQYDFNFEQCHSFNPGCFSSDYSFVVYWPAKEQLEFSRIPE
jgi:DNA polymerase epsilon subunit 2